MMIEGDVCSSKKGEIIMSHPPKRKSSLPFNDWIKKVIEEQKGVKLDFKDEDVVVPCLRELPDLKTNGAPIFLNADTFPGPGGKTPCFQPQKFISACRSYYPQATLSVGWTTVHARNGECYSLEMIKRTLEETKSWKGEITFCFRACYLKKSWPEINFIFKNSPHTITIWNEAKHWNEVFGQTNLIEWIRENANYPRTFYDLTNGNGEVVRL